MTRNLTVVAALAACMLIAAPVSAQFGTGNSANNLFSQYTTSNGSVTAGMYPAPHPAPYMGAHSYYTYQPLMPHEMMYQHSRNYFNYYNAGGCSGGANALNKTTVRWQSGNNHIGPLPFSTGLSGLSWAINKRLYCIDENGNPCGSNGIGGGIRGHFQGKGQRLRGGFGCANGQCGSEGAVIDDVYSAEGMGSSCATGGCSANLGTNTLKR